MPAHRNTMYCSQHTVQINEGKINLSRQICTPNTRKRFVKNIRKPIKQMAKTYMKIKDDTDYRNIGETGMKSAKDWSWKSVPYRSNGTEKTKK